MGAHEFDNVRPYITGEPVPGGTLTMSTTGTAGLPVWVVASTFPGESFLHPVGSVFFDLSSPAQSSFEGTIPTSRPIPIPVDVPIGTTVVIQALTVGPQLPLGRRGGNTSNPITLTIRTKRSKRVANDAPIRALMTR